ncbi:MAG: hemolysin family protein, partial [Pseudonocardiaceae bacterium]
GRTGARQLAIVVVDRPRHINLLLLLRLACELAATVLVTVAMQRLVMPGWLALLTAVLVMLVVSYVLVGVGPRTVGRQHPYATGLVVAGPVRVLANLLSPLTRLLILVGNAITPGRGFREGPFSSEVELRELVDMASDRGVVEPGEREMIHSVFELGDTLVREVMVPRPDIVFIERGKTVRQALNLALRSGFSRIPVIRENADDVIGVTYLKDLVRRSQESRDDAKVDDCMRPATFVPDSKPADEVLREMQHDQIHMAVVIDEYGGTAGIVTIEDILEEIVGEIEDEYDLPDEDFERLDDRRILVDGTFPIDDFNEQFQQELPQEDYHTVAGYVFGQLGRAAERGDEITYDGLRFEVVEVAGPRIERLEVEFLAPEQAEEHEAAGG